MQQRIHARFAATEGDKARHAGAAAAGREDFVAEAGTGRRVEDTFFFKSREAVRREDFRPFVAVIARRIAAREDMAELHREAVCRIGGGNGDGSAHGGVYVQRLVAPCCAAVVAEVEQGKFELTQHRHR